MPYPVILILGIVELLKEGGKTRKGLALHILIYAERKSSKGFRLEVTTIVYCRGEFTVLDETYKFTKIPKKLIYILCLK